MCVIILKDQGKSIPYEKLKNACLRNSHGWGVAVVDRGKMDVTKGFNKDGNDPEHIARFLEDLTDNKCLIHFRLATMGNKDITNTQPFEVLRKASDGTNVVFAHNGTMKRFDSKLDISDSLQAVNTFVRPLLKRCAAYSGPDEVLNDEFAVSMLKEIKGFSGIFALLDEHENSLVVEQDQGFLLDFGWVSNTYSFMPPSTLSTYTPKKDYYHGSYLPYKPPVKEDVIDIPFETTKQHKSFGITPDTSGKDKISSPSQRETFYEAFGIPLSDMVYLDSEDIRKICEDYPDAAQLLIEDLLWHLYVKENKTRVPDTKKKGGALAHTPTFN